MDEDNSSSNNSEYGKELDCRYPSPISSWEPSFSDGGCNSSHSKTSFTSNGSKQGSSADAHERLGWITAKKPQLSEGEMELLDSASSILVRATERNDLSSTFVHIDFGQSSHWESEYVREVLNNAEWMLEDLALGQVHKVITPDLFDRLENLKTGPDKNMEGYFKLGRKVWFDCLSECLEFRCERLFSGSCKAWVKWTTLFRRKEWFAEELYKEICGWTSMGDLMVDELVDKDMSTQYGKWVDFEIEAFEEGIEIEKGILTSLVDDLVADLLLF